MGSPTPLRRALLVGWLVLGALMVVTIVAGAAGWAVAGGVLSVIASVGVVAYLIATWGPDKVAREQAFLDTYGSLDGAKAALDLEALRSMRDTQGLIPTVRKVRHEHPAIPLAQAAEIVRGL